MDGSLAECRPSAEAGIGLVVDCCKKFFLEADRTEGVTAALAIHIVVVEEDNPK